MKNILILIFLFTLTGCFKEDEFVIEPIKIQEIKLPYSMYEVQAYYNLANAEVLSHSNYADWDLGFESSTTGYHIILNSSKFMYAGNTGLTDFHSVTTNVADTMIFDKSNGDLNSTAIGEWADFSNLQAPIFYKKVYIINRGVDEEGNKFGFKKIVFEKLENDTYFIRYANLDNSDEHTFQIPKNPLKNIVQFSFDNGGNINAQQPDKDLWDICFTKYTSILFDDFNVPTPYLLRGVLINSNNIEVARDTINTFTSITNSNIDSYTFFSNQDIIGYDWKEYKNDIYSIVDNITYIIKDRNNSYYKLRFTGFYNSIKDDPNYGAKGYPSFEIFKLTE
ncbi:MAG: HmuY family protein [Tenuifilaceae bacterium]